MNRALVLWFILSSVLTISHGYYNPIPVGCVIVSTTSRVAFLQPQEYGGDDSLTTIFTAENGTTILTTIYDPTPRNVYILYTNKTGNGIIYISQLVARAQLSTTIYQLPISTNVSSSNQMVSFTADVANTRAFLTSDSGTITMFSMSGLMQTAITAPANISGTMRSVMYNNKLNRLFAITSSTVYSCTNLETNQLVCCSAAQAFASLRSLTFDLTTSDSFVYVIDQSSGVYQITLDSIGCPQSAGPVSSSGSSSYIQLAVDQNLYFYSKSVGSASDNSYLVIGKQNQPTREVALGMPIVALHISYPSTGSTAPAKETCFNGITYTDYRVAVVLAALFGTIMGIFMCFNALFCIDFFMTKRIIRNLKQQIPHNLLEDRWNKLVEEKYAKIALESTSSFSDSLSFWWICSAHHRGTQARRPTVGAQA